VFERLFLVSVTRVVDFSIVRFGCVVMIVPTRFVTDLSHRTVSMRVKRRCPSGLLNAWTLRLSRPISSAFV